MKTYIAALLIFVSSLCTAQEKKDIEVRDVVYLSAESAEVIPAEDSVAILTEGLKPERQYAAILTVVDEPVEYVEAQRLIEIDGVTVGVWPAIRVPRVQGKENQFLLRGNPGDRFGVAVRTATAARFEEVKIAGDPEPPPPPPSEGPSEEDLSAIRDLARTGAAQLNDSVTATEIANKLSEAIPGLDSQLDVATQQVKKAIEDGLIESMKKLRPPYKDWKGKFRVPVNTKILSLEAAGKVTETKHLAVIVGAIIDGLRATASQRNIVVSPSKNWRPIFPGPRSLPAN